MRIKTLFLFFIAFGFVAFTVQAQNQMQGSTSAIISAYRFYKDIDKISINVPTIIEVPFGDEFIERFDFAILDKTTNLFEPQLFKQETITNETPVSVDTSPANSNEESMIDKNVQTYTEFLLPESAQGHVQIILTSPSAIISSALTTLLDDNVSLPSFVEIRALVNGRDNIVLSSSRMNQNTIRFPRTESNHWTINFIFGQPLRISELRLIQENLTQTTSKGVRFLAQPSHTYRIYFDPDRQAIPPVGESGNLASIKEVSVVPYVPSKNNPNYIIADVDSDGIPDIRDNCVFLANSDQKDANNNERGDACDDFDLDGIINAKDNCPNNPNRDQIDTDSDGKGDVCDQEESRVTERHVWIPWIGIGFAALVLVILLALTAKGLHNPKE